MIGIEPIYTRATIQCSYQYQPHSLKNEYLIGLRLTDDYPRIYLPTEKIGAGQRELPSSIPTLGTNSTSSGWTDYQHFHGLFAFVNILAQNVKLLPSATRPCANVLYRSFLPSRQTSLLAFLRFAALPSYHLTQIQEMVLTPPAITLATLSGVLFLIISALCLRIWLRASVRKSHLFRTSRVSSSILDSFTPVLFNTSQPGQQPSLALSYKIFIFQRTLV